MAGLRAVAVVVDARDPEVLASSWARALGAEIVLPRADSAVTTWS